MSKGGNSVAEAIAGELQVFGADVAGQALASPLVAGKGVVGGTGKELYVGAVMLEAAQGTTGVIPGGDEDHFSGTGLAEERKGEERVFAGGPGVGFEPDGVGWDALFSQQAPVSLGIALAGDDEERGISGQEEFSCPLRPFIAAAAKNHDHVGAGRSGIDAQDLLGKQISGQCGQHQQREDGEKSPQQPFTMTDHESAG